MGKVTAYTPSNLVEEMLNSLSPDVWQEGKTFLDPECGDGNFLTAIALRKKELGHINILATLYGTDINQIDVEKCRTKLLSIVGHNSENSALVENNIRCENALTYDYSFKE